MGNTVTTGAAAAATGSAQGGTYHVEILGMPLSGRRTLARALEFIESASFEEQPHQVRRVIRRQVQYTGAQAALLCTADLLEKPPAYEALKKDVECGIDALLRDDKLYRGMLEHALAFDKDKALHDEVHSVINPVSGTSFAGFADMDKIFKADYVPSRRQIMSIRLPDDTFTEPLCIKSRFRYNPLEFAAKRISFRKHEHRKQTQHGTKQQDCGAPHKAHHGAAARTRVPIPHHLHVLLGAVHVCWHKTHSLQAKPPHNTTSKTTTERRRSRKLMRGWTTTARRRRSRRRTRSLWRWSAWRHW